MKGLFRAPAFVIFYLLCACTASAQISWVRKFDDALKQAQSTGKFIVVDVFADWCPPCRVMAQEVYTDSVFIDFSRAQIFMLLDGEADSEGIKLSGKFDVHTYPTILVLDSRGQEIDRLIGGRNAKTLMNDLQAIFDNPMPYGELVRKAKANTGDYELQYRAGERAFNRDDFSSARQFLSRAADKSNKDASNRSASLLLLAVASFKDGKYPEALTALDDFERAAPDVTARDSELRLLRGRILISAKRYDEGTKVLSDLLRSSHSRKEIENARTALSQLPGKYRKGNQDYESILNNAKKELQKGKLDSALVLGQQASTLAPQAAEVHMLLAVINFRMGNSDGDQTKKSQHISAGLNEMRLARRLDPEDMNIYSSAKNILASKYLPQSPELPAALKSFQTAEAFFAAGRYEEAVKAFMKTIELEPGFGKAYLHCGDCFFATGKIDVALKLYQQAIARNPFDASAYRFAADALRKLGKADEARRYLKSALLADPEYPMIWRDLEQIAYAEGGQLGRHTDLVPIQFLLLGTDTSTYDESIYDNLPLQTVPAWKEYVRSKLLWRQERFATIFPREAFYHASFEEELESLQSAIKKWNSMKTQDASIRDENLDFLRQISVDEQLPAFIYLELFTEEYRNSYEKWKKENPGKALSYIDSYITGRAGVVAQGEYNSSAIEAFNSALNYQKAGNKEQALHVYLKALAQEPEMVPALRNLSILYLEMSDFENAQANLEKWSRLEPNEADPLVMMSQIRAREGDFDAAVSLVEKALKLEKDPAKKSQYQKIMASMQSRPGMKGGNSRSRIQQEDDEDATEDSSDRLTNLEKRCDSLKDGEEKDSLMLTLAVAHFESRNWIQARRYASMVLAKDPDQPTAKAIMENLRDKN